MRSANSSQVSGRLSVADGQPEAVLDEVALAGHVALVHAADLRHGHVRLVDDQQEVLREVVDQRGRRGAGAAAVDVARVVLDARAEADLAHHLDVVAGAHAQPLGLEHLALALELGEALLQLGLDGLDGLLHALGPRDVVGRREDADVVDLPDHVAGERVEVVERLDLVAEELDADRELLVRRDDLHGVAADPERAAGEGHVVALVLHVDQGAQQGVAVELLADGQLHRAVEVRLRRAEAVDAGHRGDHDDVAAAQEVGRGRVAQPLDVLVDRGVLLDVGVRLRDVRLGLVVVVVRDEVLDRVVGQQLAQLVGQLGGQRLVGRHHERRALHPLDEPGRGGRLAGAGGAEQHDVVLAALHPLLEVLDGRGLVARRGVRADDLERHTGALDLAHRAVLGVRERLVGQPFGVLPLTGRAGNLCRERHGIEVNRAPRQRGRDRVSRGSGVRPVRSPPAPTSSAGARCRSRW